MNEFEGKTKEQLEVMKLGLESYIQGHKDFFENTRINYLEMIAHFTVKLDQCQSYIDKVSE